MSRNLPDDRALVARGAGRAADRAPTGNLWDLTERLHVDLERTASSVCRP